MSPLLRSRLSSVASPHPLAELRRADPSQPDRPATAALDAVVAVVQREADAVDLDPLDAALVDALAGLRDAMQGSGESLDELRRQMVRLGMETLG